MTLEVRAGTEVTCRCNWMGVIKTTEWTKEFFKHFFFNGPELKMGNQRWEQGLLYSGSKQNKKFRCLINYTKFYVVTEWFKVTGKF